MLNPEGRVRLNEHPLDGDQLVGGTRLDDPELRRRRWGLAAGRADHDRRMAPEYVAELRKIGGGPAAPDQPGAASGLGGEERLQPRGQPRRIVIAERAGQGARIDERVWRRGVGTPGVTPPLGVPAD